MFPNIAPTHNYALVAFKFHCPIFIFTITGGNDLLCNVANYLSEHALQECEYSKMILQKRIQSFCSIFCSKLLDHMFAPVKQVLLVRP